MAYALLTDVAAYCQNLLGGEDGFGTSSSPTSTEVIVFLSSGCAIIESVLSDAGYVVPVVPTALAYDWIRNDNAIYAAAQAQLTRTITSLGMGERTIGQVFNKMFWDDLERLKSMDLTAMGVPRTLPTDGAGIYAGGINTADKDANISDTSRVAPRFTRDQFTSPGTLRPGSKVSRSETDY